MIHQPWSGILGAEVQLLRVKPEGPGVGGERPRGEVEHAILTEDEGRRLHDEIQKLLKEHEEKVTQVQERKTAEIMEV